MGIRVLSDITCQLELVPFLGEFFGMVYSLPFLELLTSEFDQSLPIGAYQIII